MLPDCPVLMPPCSERFSQRTTRFTMLLHLPLMPGHGLSARTKNGPALAGHGAEAGAELAQHTQLRIDVGVAIYFCNPRSPWQRGTTENINGPLRQ